MNLIKKYRQFYIHKTQTELAEEFDANGLKIHNFNGARGFRQSDISKLEKGLKTPDFMVCEYIAKKLNVTSEEVLKSVKPPQKPAQNPA